MKTEHQSERLVSFLLSAPIPPSHLKEIGRLQVETLPLHKNLQEKYKMDLNCENIVACQTVVKYLLCTRHGIQSKAPRICMKHDPWSQKTYCQLKLKELLIMTLIQIYRSYTFLCYFFYLILI